MFTVYIMILASCYFFLFTIIKFVTACSFQVAPYKCTLSMRGNGIEYKIRANIFLLVYKYS